MKYIFFLCLAMWCYAGGALAPDSSLHTTHFKPSEHKEGLAKSSLVNTITVDLNQTGFEKGATFRAFPSHKKNVKHAFSNQTSISTLIEQIKESEQPEQALKLLPYLRAYLLIIDNEYPEYSRENRRIQETIHHIAENFDELTGEEWLDFLKQFDLWDTTEDEAEEQAEGLANQTTAEKTINKTIHLSLFGGGGGAIAHIKPADTPVKQSDYVPVDKLAERVLENKPAPIP